MPAWPLALQLTALQGEQIRVTDTSKTVSIETINNTSGNNGGYGNFTNQSATLFAGTDYTIALTPGFVSGAAYFEYWTVYIDFNQDGIFEPNEMVGQIHNAITARKSFPVPVSALNGPTRMRIQMQAGAYQDDPCATYTYGEVEDYTVVIARLKDEQVEVHAELPNTADFNLYPNPASGNIFINQITGTAGEVNVDVMNLSGQIVASYKLTNADNRVPVNGLPNGNYFIRIYNNEMNVVKRFIKI